MKNNISLIYEDYLLMKEKYLYIKKELDSKNYSIPFNNPMLLSKQLTEIKLYVQDPMGNGHNVKILVTPKLEGKFSAVDKEYGFEKVNLPF
jgi:hypothetical protein